MRVETKGESSPWHKRLNLACESRKLMAKGSSTVTADGVYVERWSDEVKRIGIRR